MYAVLTVASIGKGTTPFVKQFNIYLNEDMPYKARITSVHHVNYLIRGGTQDLSRENQHCVLYINPESPLIWTTKLYVHIGLDGYNNYTKDRVSPVEYAMG
jgi:hypothetical protein